MKKYQVSPNNSVLMAIISAITFVWVLCLFIQICRTIRIVVILWPEMTIFVKWPKIQLLGQDTMLIFLYSMNNLTLLRFTQKEESRTRFIVSETVIAYATIEWYLYFVSDIYKWDMKFDIITPFTEY